MIVFLINYYSK